MSTIGIVGTGNIGGGLARLTTQAGLRTILCNSRGPASLVDTINGLGPLASAATVAQTVDVSDLVVLAVPLPALSSLPFAAFDGAVVVDAMNYYPHLTGRLPELEVSGLRSSEFVARELRGARVVKALNNVDFLRLVRLPRPARDPERSALPIAGDDGDAKRVVAAFLDAIGFDSLDLGDLTEGRRFEPGTPLYVSPYFRDPDPAPSDPRERFTAAETVPVPAESARMLADEVS